MRNRIELIAIVISLFTIGLFVSSSPGETVADEARQVKKLLAEGDSYRVLTYLQSRGDAPQIGERYSNLVRDLYWKEKDLPGLLIVARFGISYCLTKGLELAEDAEKSEKLLALAKTIAFNLGSFTWPAWQEPGIEITPAAMAAGLDAAKLNLRLAHKLKKPPVKVSAAYWLLGAQQLAHKQYAAAEKSFAAGEEWAEKANSAENQWMNAGYEGIAIALQGRSDEGKKKFAQAVSNLRELSSDDAKFFVEQLNQMWQYFLPE